jgi:hypothetical protein
MVRLLIAEVLNMLFQVLKGPGPLVGISTYEVNIDQSSQDTRRERLSATHML